MFHLGPRLKTGPQPDTSSDGRKHGCVHINGPSNVKGWVSRARTQRPHTCLGLDGPGRGGKNKTHKAVSFQSRRRTRHDVPRPPPTPPLLPPNPCPPRLQDPTPYLPHRTSRGMTVTEVAHAPWMQQAPRWATHTPQPPPTPHHPGSGALMRTPGPAGRSLRPAVGPLTPAPEATAAYSARAGRAGWRAQGPAAPGRRSCDRCCRSWRCARSGPPSASARAPSGHTSGG